MRARGLRVGEREGRGIGVNGRPSGRSRQAGRSFNGRCRQATKQRAEDRDYAAYMGTDCIGGVVFQGYCLTTYRT